jgi:hypothetical protein
MWIIVCIALLGQLREQPPVFPKEGWETINHPNFGIPKISYRQWYVFGETQWEKEFRMSQPLPALPVPRPPVPYLPGADFIPEDVRNPQPIKRPLQNLKLPLKGILRGWK